MGLHHQTEWVAYPDISDTISRFGLLANQEEPFYSLPVLRSESRLEVIMNVPEILAYLETEYDGMRRVFPRGSKADQIMSYVDFIDKNVTTKMMPMVIPTNANILQEGPERDAYLRDKERKLGVKVQNMFPLEKRESMWRDLHVGLDKVSGIIDGIERREGEVWPFGAGKPTFADFVLCSTFIWFDRAGPAEGWHRVKGWHGGKWGRLYESCQPYMRVK